jgi:ubiquinone/menaquinone biosynthesis C-methylase UbiE
MFDARRLLANSFLYSSIQRLLGATGMRRTFIHDYLRPKRGMRILDIGCGTADILDQLTDIDYVGIDSNEHYLRRAKKRYGRRATFLHCRVDDNLDFVIASESFDVVMANGVLHHLTDEEARALLSLSRRALKPEGRFLSFDGCFEPRQSRIARYFLSKDRGRFVRTREEYITLARGEFAEVSAGLRSDLLKIPYTHLIMECRLKV